MMNDMNNLEFARGIWDEVKPYHDIVGDVFPEDFSRLPIINKQNYLLTYPSGSLCLPGSMDAVHLIGASSGFSKTGSVYWPKRPSDELDYIHAVEGMFIDNYQIDSKSTLCIECLAFGMWIGGMQLATAIRLIGLSGKYHFTIATPGLDLKAAVNVIKEFGAGYDQLLIITNPSNIPVISSIIKEMNVQLKPASVYFPVVGEYFSEAMRERICRQFGHPEESTGVLWTGYGSADTGAVSCETEATIRLRKWFHHHPEKSIGLFGTGDTPMILEINPDCFVEIIDEHIVVTKDQFIPLVRYDTNDRGGILEREQLEGMVPAELLETLPGRVMYVCGRVDNAVVFYGTNLLVSDIHNKLLSLPEEAGYGGLFTVHLNSDDDISTLEFVVYTQGKDHYGSDRFKDVIIDFLCGNNAEFGYKYRNLAKSVDRPLIILRTEDVSVLSGNLKHRFIIQP